MPENQDLSTMIKQMTLQIGKRAKEIHAKYAKDVLDARNDSLKVLYESLPKAQ